MEFRTCSNCRFVSKIHAGFQSGTCEMENADCGLTEKS